MERIARKMTALLLTAFLLAGTVAGGAEAVRWQKEGEVLQVLGLLKGTGQGLELEKGATRAQAAVMLVRLLGQEESAANRGGHPFKDVPDWADAHVGHLYALGLVKGMGAGAYGSDRPVTVNDYSTMLLRALGHKDGQDGFTWERAAEYGAQAGLTTGDKAGTSPLSRDLMAKLSYDALFMEVQGEGRPLVEVFREKGVLSGVQLARAATLDSRFAPYADSQGDRSEVRAVWISYLELRELLPGADGVRWRETAGDMLDKLREAGMNTVIVQVRPFGDAFYASELFPWSHMATGEEGRDPGYDPFGILVEEAHARGLKVEAWINPYRIRNDSVQAPLAKGNPANAWMEDGSNRVLAVAQGLYYNPASPQVRALIVGGVEEILENYPVDGIHFDDYFYPSRDLSYDLGDYERYLQGGGGLSQPDWRRQQVDFLVAWVHRTVKEHDPDLVFGISPQASIPSNYEGQYSDVRKWVSQEGYVDYISPQIYFGYEHGTMPYRAVLEEWQAMLEGSGVDLLVGLAAYKVGTTDAWAGAGKGEWLASGDILARMVDDARKQGNYKGFILFRYNHLFRQEPGAASLMDKEMESLQLLW
ncbi:glycoside hydrolase family 10 protein [Anaerotalea alkaliphila]|uniref:Family 10 glycosylhydrolase n=1 Tax=Anaerotalea alkaliphila TaxID=2662126 RepID=A0A7X5HTS3_9FIRM|nr:family 10 glycosylhydrolase [Anaerotalea alkaliphila]NDL66517.1 family 10 glycosylhydrolase [Anaerotalea alkaliphila]